MAVGELGIAWHFIVLCGLHDGIVWYFMVQTCIDSVIGVEEEFNAYRMPPS